MKNFLLIISVTVVTLFLATSCQRNSSSETFADNQMNMAFAGQQSNMAARTVPAPTTCKPDAYIITLESRSQINGYWQWVWSVQNPNPGNGRSGTTQDLSHWGMQLGSCVNLTSVTSAGYSSDGITWSNFTPSYKSDPSQGCMTTPVLKFDFGTSGSAKKYYRLVVSQDYTAGLVQGYYKSGANTGCCTFNFMGISECGAPVEIEIVE